MASYKRVLNPRTVLVVEDEALVRMLVADTLIDAGYLVIEAGHADEAIDILDTRAAGIDLMFSDIHMPGTINGLELALFVRLQWPQIAIILASANALPSPAQIPPNARFLIKPYDVRDLMGHLQEMVPSL
jgi:CheY-like chemotaxis protein